LDGFIGEPRFFEEIVEILKANSKCKVLASGIFSTVLSYGESRFVIKVGRSRCADTLDGWLDFALWARPMGSEHFPAKIKILRRPEFHGDIFVACMERLHCTIAQAAHASGAQPITLSTEEVRIVLDACRTFRRDPIRWSDYIHQELAGRWPFLRSDLRALAEHFSTSWQFDLHSKNVMFRRDGSLVIVDPILKRWK